MCVLCYNPFVMGKYHYKKIIKSGKKISKEEYIKRLSEKYNSKCIKINIKNKNDNDFIIFIDALKESINEYNELSKECLKLRDSDFKSYFRKFQISEIDSSLKIEGINSTRKIVNEIISNKKEEDTKDKKIQIKKLIQNMNDAMNWILRTENITINNIFVLYSHLVKDLDMESPLEKTKFYREDGVEIGKDKGINWKAIPKKMNSLVSFINSDLLEDIPIVKALVAHYIFEHIHPYFDFNGRVGRMLHLWILKKIDTNEIWKNIYLSESIQSFKNTFSKAFNKMNLAKELNIDLTLWVSYLLDIFIEHNKAYIKMKRLVNKSEVKFNDKARLFLMNIILESKENNDKWFSKKHFKKIYPDYSPTIGDRVMQTFAKSNLFDIRLSNINEYRLKKEFLS